MDKQQPFIIDVRPVRSEMISARQYLKLVAEKPSLIARAEFVPPRAGSRGFGEFLVRYTRARHRAPVHG